MPLIRPDLSSEVADALEAGRPVVALESTIITHGMPFPANLQTALAVEAIVSAHGAVPATIAIMNGRVKVGLEPHEIAELAEARRVVKASSRDLAAIMVQNGTAGTTVSATMRLAELAGIRIFATGGVGGVHRGAEFTFDISADLTELGRTPTTVVSAGVKSILDIAKTLEVLETQRVPIIAYGSDDFPAFFTRSSGFKADHRLDSPEDIARAMHLHYGLDCGTGIMIANPIPHEAALDRAFIDDTIVAAVAEADARGITRKALTPFLLQRINELSDGRSLVANIALIKSNAALAAQIACAYASIAKTGRTGPN